MCPEADNLWVARCVGEFREVLRVFFTSSGLQLCAWTGMESCWSGKPYKERMPCPHQRGANSSTVLGHSLHLLRLCSAASKEQEGLWTWTYKWTLNYNSLSCSQEETMEAEVELVSKGRIGSSREGEWERIRKETPSAAEQPQEQEREETEITWFLSLRELQDMNIIVISQVSIL